MQGDATMAKCAGDTCKCEVTVEGTYCNFDCEAADQEVETCPCGHDACKS